MEGIESTAGIHDWVRVWPLDDFMLNQKRRSTSIRDDENVSLYAALACHVWRYTGVSFAVLAGAQQLFIVNYCLHPIIERQLSALSPKQHNQ